MKIENGYIYVIESVGVYKIGKTKNFSKRFGEYTKLMEKPKVILLQYVSNYHELEKDLHRAYFHKRERGEWFNLSEQDIKNIEIILRIRRETTVHQKIKNFNFLLHEIYSDLIFIDVNENGNYIACYKDNEGAKKPLQLKIDENNIDKAQMDILNYLSVNEDEFSVLIDKINLQQLQNEQLKNVKNTCQDEQIPETKKYETMFRIAFIRWFYQFSYSPYDFICDCIDKLYNSSDDAWNELQMLVTQEKESLTSPILSPNQQQGCFKVDFDEFNRVTIKWWINTENENQVNRYLNISQYDIYRIVDMGDFYRYRGFDIFKQSEEENLNFFVKQNDVIIFQGTLKESLDFIDHLIVVAMYCG